MSRTFDMPEKQEMSDAHADVLAEADRVITSAQRCASRNHYPTTKKFKTFLSASRLLQSREQEASSPCSDCIIVESCTHSVKRARFIMEHGTGWLGAGRAVRFKAALLDHLPDLTSEQLADIRARRGISTGKTMKHEGLMYVQVVWSAQAKPNWACVEWLDEAALDA